MPEKSGFFDDAPDDPREYPARDFAEYFGRIISNGVFNGGKYLNVSASGSDANVSLSTGAAWINGYAYSVYDTPLTLPIAPATTQDRIDRIVLRLDTSSQVRRIRATVIQGTPATNPSPPNLTRSGSVYDISLAQVRVAANTSIVKPGNIKDERLDQNVCGLVNSLVAVDTSEFQKKWDEFIKSVEDQGFATPSFVNQRVATGDFSVATNSGNAYSATFNPAPTALVAGRRFTILVNADSTGAPTFNPNNLGAKPVLKPNQNPGIFKKNGIYTLVYDGKGNFILQGEGGDIQVVKGTIGADLSGTIANLPFKPAMLLIQMNVYLNEMIGWEKNGDGIYARSDAYGHIFAFKASENDAVVSGSLINTIEKELRFRKEVSLKSVNFGVNFINYTFSDGIYGQHDYYVLGT
ncbi:hypothetical protein [Paenibacillus azoreducens]|uniref:Uncharacterized protein n=1 Tax=Paenibacillus azoreducens TaxID=116718 RepID=A0A919YCT0_9BACL|nr:hypothetical protein [Paenibacillus azoreducens]GIO48842.1 hypothetical protein J34TS1_36070 [Paenibacillus azoreducens]